PSVPFSASQAKKTRKEKEKAPRFTKKGLPFSLTKAKVFSFHTFLDNHKGQSHILLSLTLSLSLSPFLPLSQPFIGGFLTSSETEKQPLAPNPTPKDPPKLEDTR
ncbi:hypothetical protein QQP08_003600, partial [Theobroma cacao]